MEGSAAEAGSLEDAFMQNPKEFPSRPATPAGVRRILRATPSAAGPSVDKRPDGLLKEIYEKMSALKW